MFNNSLLVILYVAFKEDFGPHKPTKINENTVIDVLAGVDSSGKVGIEMDGEISMI